ncbi:lipase secretion chaperone [Chitinimonas sp. JJ19]|uniref:lipase secretion chaperone n=1 Tax=Chitinimonas sp. JJ19 TaxID=3109352 RepID=UPI003002E55A
MQLDTLKSPYFIASAALLLAAGLFAANTDTPTLPAATPLVPVEAPASLQGTVSDGQLQTTADTLVLDASLIELFDYHLATVGERTLEQVLATLEAELDKRLPPKAAAEAKRLLQRYVAFKRELVALEQQTELAGASLESAQARIKAVRALRAKYFSPAELTALFGWQDTYDDDALARQAILRDSSLKPLQKQQRLAELDQRLPPEILAQRQVPVQHLTLAEQVSQARAKGADDAAVYQLRTASVGEPAAQRLAEVDREEAAWQQRIQAYLVELARIKADAALDEVGRSSAISQLRSTRFSADEQLRLRAYED